jgi:hypothetical protein
MIWKIDHAVKTERAAANPDFNNPSALKALCNFFPAEATTRDWSDFIRLAH